MNEASPKAIMYEIMQVQEELDRVVARLSKDGSGVFADVSLKKPRFEPAELGFILTVSWLCVMYFEAGKVDVLFLNRKLEVYGIAQDGSCEQHYELVRQLRTYHQHNLDLTENRNRQIQETCENWLRSQCGSPIPGNEEQWGKCLISILTDARAFLNSLRDCVRQIEKDDSRDAIVEEWDCLRKRFHPPHEFDKLIEVVAADIGRDKLDIVRFRKKYYSDWVKELELLDGTYDFKQEGRRLIEHAFMESLTPSLPITGKDIMKEFGLGPGRLIGDLLEKAKAAFEKNGGTAQELLELLRAELEREVDQAPVTT